MHTHTHTHTYSFHLVLHLIILPFRPKHVFWNNVINRCVLAGITLIPGVKKHDSGQRGLTLTRITVHFGEDLGDRSNSGHTRLEQIHRHSTFDWGKSWKTSDITGESVRNNSLHRRNHLLQSVSLLCCVELQTVFG